MCKAGFAGDDAPRAVFRKSILAIAVHTIAKTSKHPLSVVLVTMGMQNRPIRRHHVQEIDKAQYHDRYGSKGLLRW